MVIPKTPKPFTVERARASATLRFADGSPDEHCQGDSDAYMFAACDRIEELEAEAKKYRLVLTRMITSGIDWRGYPRNFEVMERCLEENDQRAREAIGKDKISDAITEELEENFQQYVKVRKQNDGNV